MIYKYFYFPFQKAKVIFGVGTNVMKLNTFSSDFDWNLSINDRIFVKILMVIAVFLQ